MEQSFGINNLVLVDGQSNVARIAKRAKGITPEVVRTTLDKLSHAGLVGLASELHADALDASGLFSMSVPAAAFAGAKTGAVHAMADLMWKF